MQTGSKLACKPVCMLKSTSEESPMLLVRLQPDKKIPVLQTAFRLAGCSFGGGRRFYYKNTEIEII